MIFFLLEVVQKYSPPQLGQYLHTIFEYDITCRTFKVFAAKTACTLLYIMGRVLHRSNLDSDFHIF